MILVGWACDRCADPGRREMEEQQTLLLCRLEGREAEERRDWYVEPVCGAFDDGEWREVEV